MAKNSVKEIKNNTEKKGTTFMESLKRGIMAGVMFTVVVSIAWSSYTIWNGIEGNMPKVMVIPQMLFASFLTIKAFAAKENQ